MADYYVHVRDGKGLCALYGPLLMEGALLKEKDLYAEQDRDLIPQRVVCVGRGRLATIMAANCERCLPAGQVSVVFGGVTSKTERTYK